MATTSPAPYFGSVSGPARGTETGSTAVRTARSGPVRRTRYSPGYDDWFTANCSQVRKAPVSDPGSTASPTTASSRGSRTVTRAYRTSPCMFGCKYATCSRCSVAPRRSSGTSAAVPMPSRPSTSRRRPGNMGSRPCRSAQTVRPAADSTGAPQQAKRLGVSAPNATPVRSSSENPIRSSPSSPMRSDPDQYSTSCGSSGGQINGRGASCENNNSVSDRTYKYEWSSGIGTSISSAADGARAGMVMSFDTPCARSKSRYAVTRTAVSTPRGSASRNPTRARSCTVCRSGATRASASKRRRFVAPTRARIRRTRCTSPASQPWPGSTFSQGTVANSGPP